MKYLIALAGNSLDSSPVLLLDINNVLYLFSMPDCCDRSFVDSNYSIKRVKHIFLSSTRVEDSGGLLGTIVSLMHPYPKDFEITGPKEIVNLFLNNAFLHSRLGDVPLKMSDKYSDENLSATMFHTGASYGFSIKCSGSPGKFLPEVAKKLGIKPGPEFKKLKEGETLYNDKGEAVTLNDCVSSPIPGENLLIVNIKTIEDIKFLKEKMLGSQTSVISNSNSRNNISRSLSNGGKIDMSMYDVIVHLTPIDIVNNEEYIQCFPTDKVNICFPMSGRITYPVSEKVYKKYENGMNGLIPSLSYEEDSQNYPKSFMPLYTGDSYMFSPLQKKGLNKSQIHKTFKGSYNSPLPQFETFALTVLGSGAAKPALHRNDPGYLVHTKGGFVALDVGEGFLGQLRRRFGRIGANYVLENLSLIFISHGHSDHCFGLHALLRARSLITNKKLPIICNSDLINELSFFETLYSNDSSFYANFYDITLPENETVKINEFVSITTIPVFHTSRSRGCVLEIRNAEGETKRLAYSGDRMATANDEFVEKVGKVDFLLHEGTFSNELNDEMDDYAHSTVDHAIKASEQMNASYTAIIHISSRYEGKHIPCRSSNAFIVFDYLTFTYENIHAICSAIKSID
ncbi:metallo-beta-lactamase superfamily protein [Tritrichomonas foetus]|uniref:ribonuclease Z n=1 Tax=Tritrichomonas foetus TaxID=1144522 RepID=A0A1J4K4H0_9EUKA|nr:metallo-beta-lactamase superfamily protein [Tritrichomonas foetus]|eukprot:OHT06345.1 metallo-beta-lactamase superfamily protein [Tritrichomonas foetus]